MTAADYIEFSNCLQYTGSNGAEMSAFVNVPLQSEVGGVLTLGYPDSEPSLVFSTGDWYNKRYNSWATNTEFSARHITKAAALQDTDTVFNPTVLQAQVTTNTTNITTNTSAVAAINTAMAGKLGKVNITSIQVPLLLLLGTVDRPIVWDRPFANANYDLSYAFDANTIGRITCAPVAGTKTATGITIRISASLLAVTVLGVVHVMSTGI